MDEDFHGSHLLSRIQLARLWFNYQRPTFLICLVAGLVVFLVSMPAAPRVALFRALLAQRALLSMLFLFAFVLVSLVWSAGERMDVWIFLFVNIHWYHHRWLDIFMWVITQLGTVVVALFLAAFFFWMNLHRLAAEIIFGILTLWLFVEIIKVLTDRARPFLTLAGSRVVGWRELGRSFPSGHTSQTFFLVTLLNLHFRPGTSGAFLLYVVAILVGFSRIYVGVHYPRDVLGGAALGTIWGVLVNLLDPYWLGFRFGP